MWRGFFKKPFVFCLSLPLSQADCQIILNNNNNNNNNNKNTIIGSDSVAIHGF